MVSCAEIKYPRSVSYALNAYLYQMLCTNLFTSLLVSISISPRKSIHLTGVAFQEAEKNTTIITQEHLVLGTIKGHSKMCSLVTQHNATDVSSFEGVYKWHVDICQRRNAH